MFSVPVPRALLAIAVFLLVSCGGGGGGSSVATAQADLDTTRVDTSDQLFDPARLLQIDIRMNPADYDILRQEGRSASDLFSGCFRDFDYSHFPPM